MPFISPVFTDGRSGAGDERSGDGWRGIERRIAGADFSQ
jgi:hypothetical protein